MTAAAAKNGADRQRQRCLDLHAQHVGQPVIDRINAEGARHAIRVDTVKRVKNLGADAERTICWNTGAALLGLPDH